jgi:proliferating cell nuclear antigen
VCARFVECCSDAQFEFTGTGMQLQAMDSSHVSLCFLKLDKDAFDHYRCDQPMTVSLSLPNLAKILKCASDDDSLTMKHKEDSDALQLMFESKDQDRIMDFEMKLMDLDLEQLQIPDTEYKSVVKIDSTVFKRIVADLSALGDSCVIAVKKDQVRFSTDGDVGKANIQLRAGTAADTKEDRKTDISCEEPSEQRFALRYLKFFAAATPLSEQVCLSLAKDIPLNVAYVFSGASKISFYLAPKIEDEAAE